MPSTSVWSLISSLLALIAVVVLAYFATKWISKRYSANGQATKHMAVLDRLPLGQDRMLYVVKAGDKTMLLGVTPEHIEKICDMDDELFKIEQKEDTPSFKDALKMVMKNNLGIKDSKSATKKSPKSPTEENNDFDNL